MLLEIFLWSGDRDIGVWGGGEGRTFEPVNPVIVDVSYLQWLCLQFSIYNSSGGGSWATPGACVLAVGGGQEQPALWHGVRLGGWHGCPTPRRGGLHLHQHATPTLLGAISDKLKRCWFMYFVHSQQLSTIFLFLEGSLSLSSLPAATAAAAQAQPVQAPPGRLLRKGGNDAFCASIEPW